MTSCSCVTSSGLAFTPGWAAAGQPGGRDAQPAGSHDHRGSPGRRRAAAAARGHVGPVRRARRARPDRAVRRPGQRPGRRASSARSPAVRVAAAHPAGRRGDRAPSGCPRPVDLPAPTSSTTRSSRWPAPDHPITRIQPGVERATRADVAARPVGAYDTGVIPTIAPPHERARGAPAHLPEPRRRDRGSQARQGSGASRLVRHLAGPGQRRPEAGVVTGRPGAGSVEHPDPDRAAGALRRRPSWPVSSPHRALPRRCCAAPASPWAGSGRRSTSLSGAN